MAHGSTVNLIVLLVLCGHCILCGEELLLYHKITDAGTWRSSQTGASASRRSDERNVWKVGPIAAGVPRDQRQLLDFGMCADIKIRQR